MAAIAGYLAGRFSSPQKSMAMAAVSGDRGDYNIWNDDDKEYEDYVREYDDAAKWAAEQRQSMDKLQRTIASDLIAVALGIGTALAPLALDAVFFGFGPHVEQAVAAESKRIVAEISGSGLVFKDKLKVEAFSDQKVQGVTVYISDFERPLNEKLQKDFFSDPSTAGIACSVLGAPRAPDNLPEHEQVFSEGKSLIAKTLRVERIFDREANSLVYVAFNTRVDKSQDDNRSRFKSAMCAVPLAAPEVVAEPVAAEP